MAMYHFVSGDRYFTTDFDLNNKKKYFWAQKLLFKENTETHETNDSIMLSGKLDWHFSNLEMFTIMAREFIINSQALADISWLPRK